MAKGNGRQQVAVTRALVERTALVLLLAGGVPLAVLTVWHHWDMGVFAPDAWAYWRIGQPGETWYSLPPASFGAYLYSPVFAQLVWPLAQLPWPAFAVVWVVIEAACFVWLLRPLGWGWVVVGLLWCAPELAMANIEGLIAVAVVLAIARFPGWWSVVLLTKPVLGVGVLWHVGRREWRPLALAVATTAAIALVSWLLNPAAWAAWFDFLLAHSGEGRQWLPARIALGAMAITLSGVINRSWIVPIGLIIATPVVPGTAILSLLAAVPRLVLRDRQDRGSLRPAAAPSAHPDWPAE